MKKRTGIGKSLCALIVFALLVSSAVYYKYDEVRANSSTKKAVAADSAQPGGETAADTAEEPSEVTTLKIAYLPITHALPLFETAKLLEENNSSVRIELVKYGGWSELMDALNTGRVDGASVLIEMAMKAKEQGIPLKLELLGHRDGNVVITSNEIQSADELAGKTFAIPNPQSSHNILLQILLEKNGLSTDDINVVEMTPAEMPAALQNGQIDGYCVAEPFGAKAVDAGIGHVFATSEELWPDSICCGIVLNEDAVAGKEAALETFRAAYEEAGEALDEEESMAIATEYLGQNAEIVKLSLQWILFQNLDVTESAYDSLTDKMKTYGLSQTPPDYESFVRTSGSASDAAE